MRNDVVKNDIHSTDTHGYAEAVFGLTHLPGFSFAPRISSIDKPVRASQNDLPGLAATISLKENAASDIFRQHAFYQALKAFGQIIKSLFILRYADDLGLRQTIEAQLNKVELANRFTRTVAVSNPREFTQTEKEEQEIAEACNRLTGNSIVCWNYLYLAQCFKRASDAEMRENLLRAIGGLSPSESSP